MSLLLLRPRAPAFVLPFLIAAGSVALPAAIGRAAMAASGAGATDQAGAAHGAHAAAHALAGRDAPRLIAAGGTVSPFIAMGDDTT